MIVLGISGALNHDAAVSVIKDGEILFASHSERYSKIKNDPNLNADIIQEALSYGKPDVIAWYEKPVLKKIRQFTAGQFNLAFNTNELPSKYLKQFPELKGIPIKYQSHHYTHASSGYFTSGFTDAVVVVIDSIGEYETLTIWQGSGDNLSKKFSQSYPNSIGLFYSAMTQRIGLKPQEDEYILMGMAAYGDPGRQVDGKTIVQHIYDSLDIRLNDSNRPIYHIASFKKNLHRGCKWFLPDLTTEQDHFDIAAATQIVYEQILNQIVNYVKQRFGYASRNLVIMGGCALNCSANSGITERFDNVWIMPNPGDAGSCIGASQKFFDKRINWQTPYLGHNIEGSYPVEKSLEALLDGEIIGIANGRAEFGPRALGNRTLTADPRGETIKDRMNEIKHRQKFRPFAPMILEEDVHDYFIMPENINSSPYMQFVATCKYPTDFPAIIHADGTSRVQTVNKQQHFGLYTLLTKFKEITGCPMLVNTSLNIKGQPIVNDVTDAEEFSKHYGIKVFTTDD
jgi:carbamoyltransferase